MMATAYKNMEKTGNGDFEELEKLQNNKADQEAVYRAPACSYAASFSNDHARRLSRN